MLHLHDDGVRKPYGSICVNGTQFLNEMKTTQTLTYSDILDCAASPEEGPIRQYGHHSWGIMAEHTVKEKNFSITRYTFNLKNDFHIQYEEKTMPNTMNVCMALQGDIGVLFKGRKMDAGLSSLRHHALYVNESRYDIQVGKLLQTVHMGIDLDYYISMLCEKEPWSASLKEKLLRKEDVLEGDAVITMEMQKAVHDLLNNPLQGNLRTLLMEAKVIELVALQLNQLAEVNKSNRPGLTCPDIDIFHDLRTYLHTHFTEDLSLKQLARMFGLNDFKLKRGFKDLFNTTVFDYIHTLRMEHAYRLLVEDKMFVNEVSGMIGYKNPNHFSTAFKRKFGVCPGALK